MTRADGTQRPAATIKRRACGGTYTRAQWQRLPDKSVGELPWGEVHEYRRCACGSHVVIILRESTPESVR